jgi:hypothetical protein
MKLHFTVTADQADLERLDAYARSRGLSRGKAIIALLDWCESAGTQVHPDLPSDSVELEQIQAAIDKWLPFATDGARELRDYVGAVTHVGVELAAHPEWREAFPRDTGWLTSDYDTAAARAQRQEGHASNPKPLDDRLAKARELLATTGTDVGIGKNVLTDKTDEYDQSVGKTADD